MSIDWDTIAHPRLVFRPFSSRRSVVYGTKGAVACSQPLAAEAGLEILRKGGNAADASVAVSAALNVTEPGSCGIGGDAFCLFYDAKAKQVKGLNGSGRSPQALTIAAARKAGIVGDTIPSTDLNSVTVPGAAAAWVDVVQEFGSHHVTLHEVLDPAIRMAKAGSGSELSAYGWKGSEDLIRNASPDHEAMLLNGRAPLPGEVMRFPDLAKTFRLLADKGKDGFYTGPVAQAIVDLIKSKGGVMELEDLSRHTSTFVEPIHYTFQDQCPPNGQGITALLALGILDAMQDSGKIKPLLEMEHNSAEYLHALIEALRYALKALGIDFVLAETISFRFPVLRDRSGCRTCPVKELLSKEYFRKRAEIFDPQKAIADVRHGSPVQASDTVYFSVTDQWGNGCSFIQSNYAGFGTGAIPHKCGFTLQNRGSGFILKEGHPNQLQGGKRPYHTIIPAIATRGDELFMVYGNMGGFMQPQGHVQLLLNVLRGFSVQAAVDAPRFCISAGVPSGEVNSSSAGDVNSEVYFESEIPDAVVKELNEMGHDTRKVEGFAQGVVGRGQIIQRVPTPGGGLVWAAGSDPRGDGHAVVQI
ncbi:hypothetical protein BS47DRAFT_1389027 [Hydnum rufescens UP504]|uniref:Gamma-glutamyltranspeptidase n=1 Tax=Hydnum rufescens UP504 TaxID=1448309 RepID=A0A9P6E0Q7_9AGAM|nr:hypothetical protein BS47DRAFT_1389027 [Hydnum rufescens UP504]